MHQNAERMDALELAFEMLPTVSTQFWFSFISLKIIRFSNPTRVRRVANGKVWLDHTIDAIDDKANCQPVLDIWLNIPIHNHAKIF